MAELTIKNRLELREMELNALLEITQAINNNIPEESLFKIYEFTLRANLQIRKLALFVFDESWGCKVNYGTEINCFNESIPEEFLDLKKEQKITDVNGKFGEFEYVVPVRHKTQLLALVFVSGLKENPSEHGATAANFIQAISNIIIVAIENKKLASKELEQESLRKELEIASDVQQYLFPENLPSGARLQIEASYLPHDRVGGDYYDYIAINEHQFLVCVADVSGKGIPAAILMSNFQASLRTLIRQTGNLRNVVEELNYQVLESAKGEKFITFFAAIYDHKLKSMVYVNAGHNPPILKRKSGEIELLEDGCTVLGAMNPLPFLNEGFVTDLTDFMLFMYTDGVTETMNPEGDEFGQELLEEYFRNLEKFELQEIHQDVIINLDEFKGPNNYKDDITMLSCRVTL